MHRRRMRRQRLTIFEGYKNTIACTESGGGRGHKMAYVCRGTANKTFVKGVRWQLEVQCRRTVVASSMARV